VKGRLAPEASSYEPVARTLAIYCQFDQTLFPEFLSYAWLPQDLVDPASLAQLLLGYVCHIR
jgi:hypothetical protein